jgi:hypothetical protein
VLAIPSHTNEIFSLSLLSNYACGQKNASLPLEKEQTHANMWTFLCSYLTQTDMKMRRAGDTLMSTLCWRFRAQEDYFWLDRISLGSFSFLVVCISETTQQFTHLRLVSCLSTHSPTLVPGPKRTLLIAIDSQSSSSILFILRKK